MRSRYLLVAPLAAAIALGSSGSTPDAAPTHSRRAGHDDPRRSGRAGADRLQLGHRARARRAQPRSCRAATFDLQFMDIAATVNPATVHFRSLTEPSRAERPRAELRVRSARARQAAAQVRRPRGHARAHACSRTARRARRRSRRELLSYNNAPVWQNRQARSSPACTPITSASPSCPDNLFSRPTLIWTLRERRRAARTASRRRTSPASWRGTPTTC